MIALAFAALLMPQAAPGAVSPIPPDEDIVVVGERLRRLKLSVRGGRNGKPYRCIVKRASGDAALDVRMCAVTIACAPTAKTGADLAACVRPALEAYVAETRARRALSMP